MKHMKKGPWGSLLRPKGASEYIDEGDLKFDTDMATGKTKVHHPTLGDAEVSIDDSTSPIVIKFAIKQRHTPTVMFRHYQGNCKASGDEIIAIDGGFYTLSPVQSNPKAFQQMGDGDWVPSNPPSIV